MCDAGLGRPAVGVLDRKWTHMSARSPLARRSPRAVRIWSGRVRRARSASGCASLRWHRVWPPHPSFYCSLVSFSPLFSMGRLTGRLFVAGTTCLICFITFSPQIFVIWPWYGRVFSVELIELLLPFKYVLFSYRIDSSLILVTSILVGLLLWNYRLCVITNPGQVPPTWVCQRFVITRLASSR